MVYYKEETKMALVDKKAFEGIEDTVVRKFDEAKAVSESKTRVEKMKLFMEIADRKHATGGYTDNEYNECLDAIGEVLGFKFKSFVK